MDTPPLQRCDSGDSGRVSSTSDSLTFSPDLGLSPVSNLSFSLGFLSCLDSITPRRRLKLSPGSKSPSPEASCSVATETPTLTGACLESPSCTCNSDSQTPARCCSPAPRRHPDKKQRRGEGGFKAPPGKENKRFRMRLACLFTSPNQPQREDGSSNGSRAWYQKKGRSDTKLEAVVEHPRVISHFHDSQSSLVVDTEQILDTRAEDKNLIGDFSKPHLFPVENGKHQDLKYISPAMVAALLAGRYDHTVEKYLIADCRYPYEFEGGHIKGALNIYREDQVSSAFLQNPVLLSSADKRIIVIFHCEFSSERGPRICRYLRKLDRNSNVYPLLFYPELYILKGGYKDFFREFRMFCEPQAYVDMLHCDYREDLRNFRKKRQSWAVERSRKTLFKATNKR